MSCDKVDTHICAHIHEVHSCSLGLNLLALERVCKSKKNKYLFELCDPDGLGFWCHLNKAQILKVQVEILGTKLQRIFRNIIQAQGWRAGGYGSREKNESKERLREFHDG